MSDLEDRLNAEAGQATQAVLDARDAYISAWRRWRSTKVYILDIHPEEEAGLVRELLSEDVEEDYAGGSDGQG